MYGGSFTPDRIVIEAGETLTWVNDGYNRHSVTAYEERIPDGAEYFSSGGFDSEYRARTDGYDYQKLIKENETFQHTFETPGYYDYFCIPHEDFSTMAGTVVVKEPNGDIPPTPEIVEPDTDHVVHMGPMSFTPESLTIQPGESVGWVNGTNIAHSVTASSVPDDATYFASGEFDTEEEAIQDWGYVRSGDVLAHDPYTHTFDVPGRYEYYCILHSLNMEGVVEVAPETDVV